MEPLQLLLLQEAPFRYRLVDNSGEKCVYELFYPTLEGRKPVKRIELERPFSNEQLLEALKSSAREYLIEDSLPGRIAAEYGPRMQADGPNLLYTFTSSKGMKPRACGIYDEISWVDKQHCYEECLFQCDYATSKRQKEDNIR